MKKEFKSWFDTICKCTVVSLAEDMLPKGAVFGFVFPNTFLEKEVWLVNPLDSKKAHFFEDNIAKIVTKNHTKETTWLMAYNHIAKSTYGPKFIPEPVSVEELFSEDYQLYERVINWVNLLNTLPLITAEVMYGVNDDSGDMISVCIPDSWGDVNNMMNKKEPGEARAYLQDTGKALWLHPSKKENLGILEKYLEKEYPTWQQLYEALGEYLTELFNEIPEPKSVIDEAKINNWERQIERRKKQLELWVNVFAGIPGVKAEMYNGDDPNRVIELGIPTNPGFLTVPPGSGDFVDFYLLHNGMFEEADYRMDRERNDSTTYLEWHLEEKGDWNHLYNKVLELSRLYVEGVPAAPVAQ